MSSAAVACTLVETLSERDVAARAIYSARPFYLGASRTVMAGVGTARALNWDGAPAYYQHDCYEIADAVLTALGSPPAAGSLIPAADAGAEDVDPLRSGSERTQPYHERGGG